MKPSPIEPTPPPPLPEGSPGSVWVDPFWVGYRWIALEVPATEPTIQWVCIGPMWRPIATLASVPDALARHAVQLQSEITSLAFGPALEVAKLLDQKMAEPLPPKVVVQVDGVHFRWVRIEDDNGTGAHFQVRASGEAEWRTADAIPDRMIQRVHAWIRRQPRPPTDPGKLDPYGRLH